jgi:hypothetical protein
MFRRAAEYVDKILRGQSPLTCRSSSRRSSISLSIWPPPRAIGLNISEAFLLRADKVIEQ